MARYLVIVESPDKSEDHKEISRQQLRGNGIKRTCKRFAEKSDGSRPGA